jgi:hypothetical protein
LAAGTQTATSGTVLFSNSNNVSFGLSNSSVLTASASFPAQTTQPAVNAAAGTQTATSGTVVWSNSNNVTFGMSNSSVVTISVGLPVVKAYAWPSQPSGSFGSSDAALSLVKFEMPFYQSATRMLLLGHMSAAVIASASTGGISMSVGIYTMSGSTASLASSASRFLSWTSGLLTSISSDFGNATGTRYRSISLGTWNLTPGDYLLGFWARTTNVGSWTWWGQSQTVALQVGINDDQGNSSYFMHGFSTSSFSTAMPASINVTNTDYVRTGVSALRQPGFLLQGSF